MRSVGSGLTGGPLCSKLLVGVDFAFDLVANAMSATDCSVLKLTSLGTWTVCSHSAETTKTLLTTPQLMTLQDFDPSPLKESICISMPHRPNCHEFLASWMISKMELSPNTLFCVSCRILTHDRIFMTCRSRSVSFKYNRWSGYKENLSPALAFH